MSKQPVELDRRPVPDVGDVVTWTGFKWEPKRPRVFDPFYIHQTTLQRIAGNLTLPFVFTAGRAITEYSTIQNAITAATSSDWVVVPPGTYDEALTIANGEKVHELYTGTVTINLTTGNTAVTLSGAGGYINVKEIKVTRDDQDIIAVSATHSSGSCYVYAELISATNAGTQNWARAVSASGAGTLYVFSDYITVYASTDLGEDNAAVYATAGTQYVVGKCEATGRDDSPNMYGVYCNGANTTVWGDCTATTGQWAIGAYCTGAATLEIYGDCRGSMAADGNWVAGVYCDTGGGTITVHGNCSGTGHNVVLGAGVEPGGTVTIYGHCIGTGTGSADSSGILCHEATMTVWGNCLGSGGTTGRGVLAVHSDDTVAVRVNGDCTGVDYGVDCNCNGTVTITNGRASGGTADLRQQAGTLQVYSVQYDSESGTITILAGSVAAHASKHLPSGADPITTAAAGTIQPDDSAAEGSAESLARSDHTHAIVAAAPNSVDLGANAEGSSTSFSRADHKHDLDESIAPTWTGTHLWGTTNEINLRDGALRIYSSTDGQLDLIADTKVKVTATTIDLTGNVDVSAGLDVTGNITVATTGELQFRDNALKIYSSADGQLDIDADVKLEIVAPAVEITGTLDVSGHAAFGTAASINAARVVNIEEGSALNTGSFVAQTAIVYFAPTANFDTNVYGNQFLVYANPAPATTWAATGGAIIGVFGRASVINGKDIRDITLRGGQFSVDVEDAGAGGGVGAAEATGLLVYTPYIDTGSCTTGHGLRIVPGTLGAIAAYTTQYGLRIAAITGATTNWAIYSEGGASYHAGNMGIGTTIVTNAQVEILEATLPQLRLTHTAGVDFCDWTVSAAGSTTVATSGPQFIFQNATDGTTGFQILDADGGTPIFNVDTINEMISIGMTSPVYKLQVNGKIFARDNNALGDPTGDIGPGARFVLNPTTNPFAIGLGAVDGTKYPMWFQTGDLNGGGFEWYIGTSEVVRIDKNGNLLVGTTASTGGKLEVLDTGTQLRLTHTSGVDYLDVAVDANGQATFTTVDGGGAAGHIVFAPDGNVHQTAGDLVFIGSGVGMLYAEISATNASDTITIAAAGQVNKAQVTSFDTDGVSNGATPDHTNDHITIVTAGVYMCVVSLHIESAGTGGADTISYSVYKNGGTVELTNLHGQRHLSGGGGDVGSTGISGLIDLAASDTIELWIWNDDSGDDVVVDDVTLSLVMVGGT